MESILSTGYYVHFEDAAYKALGRFMAEEFYSKTFILVDENTRKYCLDGFMNKLDGLGDAEVICISPGESFKNLDTCAMLWQRLSDLGADRKSLLINLGGGVITDMGGFVASCFKRGIRFINVPTTLLSMVDASVGGKTGVDLGVLKNQIGMFCNPEMVIIDTDFLSTVPERELKSGLAEIIKYGFTFDRKLWDDIRELEKPDLDKIRKMVHRSVEIKNDVVLEDLLENSLRKSLNFGHTVGHAIESYFLDNKEKERLTHGEAIAIGMVVELFYSSRLLDLPMEHAKALKTFVDRFYGEVNLESEDLAPIIDLMQYDKKNVSGKINFVLLNAIESCELDMQVNKELLREGLKFYNLKG